MNEEKEVVAGETEMSWAGCYDVPGVDLFAKLQAFAKFQDSEQKKGYDLFRRVTLSQSDRAVRVADPATGKPKEMLMFGSNSYLGFASDPSVVNASIDAARKYGYGTGSVSLCAGTTDLHVELERRIAEFYKCEAAVLFPTGYAANIGVISALLRERDAVVNDIFNHASIHDGCRLAGAKTHIFAHGKMRHFERVLANAVGEDHGTLVITDGVFSMEGDVAHLDQIVALSKKYGARVMIDEAHALGVVGPTGKGTAELYGMEGQIDVTIGTLSKAPGGIGGYATGSKELIDYLRYYARAYFFSTSIPTPVIAGLIEVFNLLESEPQRHEQLWENIRYITGKLTGMGFDLGKTASAVVPIMVNDEDKLKRILVDLHNAGVFMNYISFPAVPKRKCRLRMSMMAQHTREDMDSVIEVLGKIGKKYGLIE